MTIHNDDHSVDERRYIDIGISDESRVLAVFYTEHGSNLCIVSCRKANSIGAETL
jgi:uncharacterized protein